MNFSWQVAHKVAYVIMDSATSHCFVGFAFANTLGLKGSNTLVLGNGDEVPMDKHIKLHVKIQQYHSQDNCLLFKLSDNIDLILGNVLASTTQGTLGFSI